ncbi:hypothetical protein KA005_66380 [bacterium]|nr:hypothetical protein [bacterium]
MTKDEKTLTLQRRIVVLVIFLAFLILLLRTISWAIWGWPDFPEHRTLSGAKYAERVTLLKYFISLGFSLVGATWYLVSSRTCSFTLPKRFRCLLSWAWTFLGISLLSAIAQIYLTYKDVYYWPLIVKEGYAGKLHQMNHCIGLHMLHFSYHATDYGFFLGVLLLVIAFIEVLYIPDQTIK